MDLIIARHIYPLHGGQATHRGRTGSRLRLGLGLWFACVLSACGGGSGNSDATASPSNNVVRQAVWTEHKIDSLGQSIDLRYTAVTTPHDDGSYDVARTTQGGHMAPIDGVNYTIDNVESYSASGVSTRIVYRQSDTPVTCTFDGSTEPVVFPLTQGLTWTRTWHQQCDTGVTWTVQVSNGTYVGQETLITPAGTFTANHARFTQTETSSDPNIPATTKTHDCWYAASSNRKLRCDSVTTQHGSSMASAAAMPGTTPTNGYAVSGTTQLQSSNYDFNARTPPTVGVTVVYQRSLMDNSNNTVNLAFTNAITQVNADGSYLTSSTTNGGSVTNVNGTDYTVNTQSAYAANGLQVNQINNGTLCTFSVAPQNVVNPLSVGMTWSKVWSEQCGAALYTNSLTSGQVQAIENVTVPAGTFSAYKVLYTVTRAPANSPAGTLTFIQVHTCWVDVLTHKSLKCVTGINRSGSTTSTNGYATSITDTLLNLH